MSASHHPVAFQGKALTLSGREVKVDQKLPDFTLVGTDMADLTSGVFIGKNAVILSLPSLDTPVCADETRRFAKEIASFKETILLAVSLDLPFAQKRWCASEGQSSVLTGSDFKYRTFGDAYGVLIQEWGLLFRAVFIADRAGECRYVEYVPEVSSEPNYDAALAALKRLG